MENRRVAHLASRISLHLVVVLFAAAFLLPFAWLLSTSLKTLPEAFQTPPEFFPVTPQWGNYVEVFQRVPLLRYFANSMLISVVTTAGILISASMGAYSVTKINWRGSRILFPLMMTTLLLPVQVALIPTYLIFKSLHLTGTFAPLLLPSFLGGGIGGGYYIFLLRQFFLTVPDSLFESARIDGASEMRTFLTIMIPLCQPALLTVAIFNFLNTWSDFVTPLIYLTKKESYTLSLGLQAFLGEHHVEWNLLMAAAAFFTLPTIVLFFFAQKYFIEGVKTSGLKI